MSRTTTMTTKQVSVRAGQSPFEEEKRGGLRNSTTDTARKPRRAEAHVETKPSYHSLHFLTAIVTSLLPPTPYH